MPTLDQIALRPADRATLIGASGSGKSTLARFLLNHWQERYCNPRIPSQRRGRLLLLDTKPRWRGTHTLTGSTPSKRYRDFVPGDTVRGVILDRVTDWNLVWDLDLNPWQTVIAQNPELDEDENVRWQVEAAALFLKSQRHTRKSLGYVDEGMDFYGPSGTSRYGNAIQRWFRVGRERGLASLLGAQRPKCINLQTLTEANKLYLFRLEYSDDVKRLTEMGYPQGSDAPEDDYKFQYLDKKARPRLYPKQLILPKGAI